MAITLVALGVLVAVGTAALRVVLLPAFRRELRSRPLLLAAVVAAACAALGVVALATLAGTAALALLASLAVIGWLVAFWRARPSYGKRRGLPPGSLSLHDSLDAIVDRDFLSRSFGRYGTVFKMAQAHQPVVCVLGLDHGREIIRRHGDRLTPPALALTRTIPRGFVGYMTPENHAIYAPLFRRALSEAVLAASRDEAEYRAAEACARLTRVPGVPPPVPREVIEEYVAETLHRVFFGGILRSGDRATIEKCRHDAAHIGAVGRPAKAIAAVEGFGELIRRRAAEAGSEIETCYLSEFVRLAPGAIDDPTVLGNLFHLLEAARDSISSAITWAAWFLACDPAWLDAVRAERASSTGRSDPATAAVLETLRLAQSEYVYRRVEQPIEIDGFRIPAGWLLRICVAESHRTDPPFVDPERFDPERHVRERFGTSDLAPFGIDAHACLGARLTLELGRVFIETLSGYAPELAEDGPPQRGNRHWRHWAVGPDVRIVLSQLHDHEARRSGERAAPGGTTMRERLEVQSPARAP